MSAKPQSSAIASRKEGQNPVSPFRMPLTQGLLWGSAILTLLVIVMPIVYLVLRGLQADGESWQYLFRLQTLKIIWQTLLLTVSVTLASSVLSLFLSWLIVKTTLGGKNFWMVVMVLPLAIPSYVGAYLYVSALGPKGILQQTLEPILGIERFPDLYGFPGAFIVLTLLSYPYIFLTVQAALQRMDASLEETSRSLGYGPWKTFFYVILPQLKPALASGGLLVALYTIRDFGAVSIMRYDTFTRVIYIQYQSAFDRTSAALYSLLIVLLTFFILYLEYTYRGNSKYHKISSGSPRPPVRYPLGKWKVYAFLICSFVFFVTLVIPSFVLVGWLFNGGLATANFEAIWTALYNSVWVSLLTSILCILLALPIVALSIKQSHFLSRVLSSITYIGYALPGIVIALALVFTTSRLFPSIYQTYWVLLIAYFILFIPQAITTIRTSWLQIDPHLEEAGRSLGQTPGRVFFRVLLPLLRLGIASGGGLVFLTTMKELPATLLLSPFGFKTLATQVWSSVSEAFFAQAALPALIIILVSSIPMTWLIFKTQDKLS